MFIFARFNFSSFRMLLLDLPIILFMFPIPAIFFPTRAPELDSLILCDEFCYIPPPLLPAVLLLLWWYLPVKTLLPPA